MATYIADKAATEYVTIDGDSIAYRRFGNGDPLLLTNRLRGTLDTWDPLFLESLAVEHTVITFDYPGVAYSTGTLPPDMPSVSRVVVALAIALGLDRFAIGGWSWGGLVAQVVVTDHPERLTHAIIIGANPPGENQVPIQKAFLDCAFKPINDLADEEILFFVPGSKRSLAAARASHERIYARPGVTEKIPSTMEEFTRYFKAAEGFKLDAEDRRGALKRSRTPIMVLCGDHDISAAVENWFPFVGNFPSAHLIVLGDAGHAPQHEYPQLAAQYINTFLRLSGQ
jgi:pimeloyl-ACP methyl ester carboxylesterase